jgi:hypothetical protein
LFLISKQDYLVTLKENTMKNVALGSLLTIALILGTTVGVQGQNEERLGLPGDNLNLYGVMKLFQESQTLEDFERNLNDSNTMLNNLDLNGDYQVDYINVVDYVDGDVHTIVLRDALNKVDYQDVAVFTVQPSRTGNVVVQLIGDEALYGKNYIIEPYYDNVNGTQNPGYVGNTRVYYGQDVTIHRTTTVEVSAWPIIRFIFAPTYVLWRSPWYFGYYPGYWSPWRPYYWDYYSGFQHHYDDYYFGYYHRWNTYRFNHYDDFYYRDHRSHSNLIDNRITHNDYRETYSRPDLRDKGSERFQKMNPNGAGHSNIGNNNSQANRPTNNQNMNRPANNQQGQGRPSTTTRTTEQTTNQSVHRSTGNNGQLNSNEGQMRPNQGQHSGAQNNTQVNNGTRSGQQNGTQVNNGTRNGQQNGNQGQSSTTRANNQTTNGNSHVNQSSNRSTTSGSSVRPADKSGDRPTSVPGSPRTSAGNNQNRSSGEKSAVQNQGSKKTETGSGNKSSGQKSTKEKDSGRRK